jgi:replication factor C subunit 3/5
MRFKFTPLESKQVVHRLTDVGKSEGVKMDEGGCGLQAIVALSDGDMRKALNTLQACHVSFGSVTEANVYSCLGQPSPKEVDNIYTLLTEKPFSEALIGLRQLLQGSLFFLTLLDFSLSFFCSTNRGRIYNTSFALKVISENDGVRSIASDSRIANDQIDN